MKEVVIADITFSFNNSKLIHILKQRGYAIARQKFDVVKQKDAEIDALLNNPAEREKMTVPTSAFITFEEEDAYILAIGLYTEQKEEKDKSKRRKILGQPYRLKAASEPTDIIWENRHFTERDYLWRELFAYSIIIIALAGCFYLTYLIARAAAEVAKVFPPQDCDAISTSYGSFLEEYAIQDYKYINANRGKVSTGCLQCFCAQ